MDQKGKETRHTVFTSREEGYFCYRIPALIQTKKGTLIAFCEARQRSCNDWTHSAIMARRCEDPINNLPKWDGQFIVKESNWLVEPKSWTEMLEAGQFADEMGWDQEADDFEPKIDVCTNNPVPIVNHDGKTIHFVYCEHYERAFYTESKDDGKTWIKSVEITQVLEKFRQEFNWTLIASGPGHGLQLEGKEHEGRLIVPFWFAKNQEDTRAHEPTEVGFIYSDDKGKTWEKGGMIPFTISNPNETQVVELDDGRILAISRSKEPLKKNGAKTRAFSISNDGGISWDEYRFYEKLPEPVCLGSFIKAKSKDGNSCYIYATPSPLEIGESQRARKNLCLWLSNNECKTWQLVRSLEEGHSAYSDLAYDEENQILYCLFEDGSINTERSNPYNGMSIIKLHGDGLF